MGKILRHEGKKGVWIREVDENNKTILEFFISKEKEEGD